MHSSFLCAKYEYGCNICLWVVWIRLQHMFVSSMNTVATYACDNLLRNAWCCNKWVTNHTFGIATCRAHPLSRTMPRALIYSHLLVLSRLWLHLPVHNFGLHQLTLMYMAWRTLKVEAPRHSGDHNAAVRTFMPLSECSSILFTLYQTIISLPGMCN